MKESLNGFGKGLEELIGHLKEGHIMLGLVLTAIIAFLPQVGVDPVQAQPIADALLETSGGSITALQGLMAFMVSGYKLVGILGSWAVILKARNKKLALL